MSARTQRLLHTSRQPTRLLALVTEAAPKLWQKLGNAIAFEQG